MNTIQEFMFTTRFVAFLMAVFFFWLWSIYLRKSRQLNYSSNGYGLLVIPILWLIFGILGEGRIYSLISIFIKPDNSLRLDQLVKIEPDAYDRVLFIFWLTIPLNLVLFVAYWLSLIRRGKKR